MKRFPLASFSDLKRPLGITTRYGPVLPAAIISFSDLKRPLGITT